MAEKRRVGPTLVKSAQYLQRPVVKLERVYRLTLHMSTDAPVSGHETDSQDLLWDTSASVGRGIAPFSEINFLILSIFRSAISVSICSIRRSADSNLARSMSTTI